MIGNRYVPTAYTMPGALTSPEEDGLGFPGEQGAIIDQFERWGGVSNEQDPLPDVEETDPNAEVRRILDDDKPEGEI